MRKLSALFFLLAILFSTPAHAALASTVVWEFEAGGSDNNSGGFDSAAAGTDYSQSTTSHATLTTSSTVGSTTTQLMVAAGDYTVATTDVGNIVYVHGGTATAGFYEIMSVTTGGGGTQEWTMDRSLGTAGQTAPGAMGGCRVLISANNVNVAFVAGNKVWIKNGTYTISSATSFSNGTAASPISMFGYNATRGDNPVDSTRPTLSLGSSGSITLGQFWNSGNIIYTGSAATVFSTAAHDNVSFSKFTSTNVTATNNAVQLTGNTCRFFNNEIIAASCIGLKLGSYGELVYANYIHGCTVGINQRVTTGGTSITFTNNLVTACTTAMQFNANGVNGMYVTNNTFYGASSPTGTGLDGSTSTAPTDSFFENNIIYGFATGANWQAAQSTNIWDYNDFYNNTTDRTNVTAGAHDLTVDPQFTNAASGDFSIGTNLKAKGNPGVFPGATTTGYIDTGAAQRQEASSGSSGGSYAFVGN